MYDRYGTLAYCITWPTAFDNLRDIFATLSFNIVEDSKVPCWYPKFDYFDLFYIMALAPVILLFLCFAYGTLSAHFCESKKTRPAAVAKRQHSKIKHIATRSTVVKMAVKKGLASWIPLFFFVYDLIYPLVCRTLLQYFSCRELAPAGAFMERDYSIQCHDLDKEKNEDLPYQQHYAGFLVIAMFYWLGTMFLFIWLSTNEAFKYKVKRNIDDMNYLFGWLYYPFREGKEHWFALEVLRTLLLTSFIGFTAQECYYKELIALLIALAFLFIFLWMRPYRRSLHNILQATLPVKTLQNTIS